MHKFLKSIFLLLLLIVNFDSAYAQNGTGVGIKPAVVEEVMEPGQTTDFSVTISNLSEVDQTYYLHKRDIVDASADGVPVFADRDREASGFEMTKWIELSTDSVFIPAGSEVVVPFKLSAPNDITPGSHFGGIFVSVEPPELDTSGAAVGYEVANIISIRIAGETLEKASFRQFSTNKYFFGSLDVEFNAKVENSGTTLVRPVGMVSVKNMFNEEVASINFNETQAGIFPGKTREFIFNWEGDETGFGRYEALISAVYGPNGARQTITNTVTFWVLPMNIIGPSILILFIILLVTYTGIKLYVRSQISRYTAGGSRRVSRRGDSGSSGFALVLVAMLSVTALFLLVLLILFA